MDEGGIGDDSAVVGVLGFVAPIGGEGTEIMLAFHHVERFLESLGIEKTRKVPRAACRERRKNREGAEVVGVGFSGGLKAGMEIRGDFLATDDADGGGKFGVERGNPVEGVHGEMVRSVEVGDLALGMDSGISAAGTVKAEWLFGDDFEGVFDAFLDGVAIGLDLPTGVGGAVVGDGEFEAHDALPAEVVVEDFEGSGLVDDLALIFRFSSGFTELLRSGDGGEAFVEEC